MSLFHRRREAAPVVSRVPVNEGQYTVDVEARAGYVQVQSWVPLGEQQQVDLDPDAARGFAAALVAAADDVDGGVASRVRACDGTWASPSWR